jgi:hypothetical protein
MVELEFPLVEPFPKGKKEEDPTYEEAFLEEAFQALEDPFLVVLEIPEEELLEIIQVMLEVILEYAFLSAFREGPFQEEAFQVAFQVEAFLVVQSEEESLLD